MLKYEQITLRRKMSFLYRIERISGNIQKFKSGQKYITEGDWKQLRNIEDVSKWGHALLGSGPSIHNLVRIGYIAQVKAVIEGVAV